MGPRDVITLTIYAGGVLPTLGNVVHIRRKSANRYLLSV
jgi:hypothetical protein